MNAEIDMPLIVDKELKEVKSFEELTRLLPLLVKLRNSQRVSWGGDGTTEEFILELLGLFNEGKLILWADLNKQSQAFNYFMAVVKESDEVAMFWLFYIDVSQRTISGELTQISIDNLRKLGYKKIQLTTRRIVKSYARWMDKLGFKPIKIMYERNL